jgi:hypothetical protein
METKGTQQKLMVFTDYDEDQKGKTQTGLKNDLNQQSKLDLGYKLNNAKQKRNCKAQRGYRTGNMWRCNFLWLFVDFR